MMEVIRSTNITFNSNDIRKTSNENVSTKKANRTPHSPVDLKDSSPSKPTMKPNSVIKGQVEGPSQASVETPRLDDSPLFRRVHAMETPMMLRKRESPADSGIELSPISFSTPRLNPKLRTMYNNSRREGEEGTDFSINPDPVPYQPNNFMSSTMMKKVPVTRRHFDSFGSFDFMANIAKRGMMLHTDRYQWDLAKALDGLSQRERLHAELEYMERLRGIKRRREVLPHRAQLDLLMGGKKVEFNERFQIQREIEKLKSLILPQHAKDLYHGRGFVLPSNHNSIRPRHPLDPLGDLEDDLSSPFSPDKYSFNPETGRVHPRNRQYPVDQSSSLPKINSKGYLLGSSQQAYMTRSKTNVTTGGQAKQGGGGRSLTAMPAKKDGSVRPGDVHEQVDETSSKAHDGHDTASRISARSIASPSKAPTPNPLKAVEIVRSMSQDEQARLKQTFNKLDTDKDGHIMFSQLQTQLPKQFSQAQEKYIKQVYDITSSNTFFGVDEFMTMSYLTSVVTDLTGEPLDAYNKLDFHGLHEVILKYVELYQTVDRSHRGKIALSSLQEILTSALSLDFKAEPPRWNKLIDTIETLNLSEPGVISKIEFLAHIPYFQTFAKRK